MIVSEATATGDDATLIRNLVTECLKRAIDEGRLPKQIRPEFTLEFGEDSSGDPAVWIWLPTDAQRASKADGKQAADLTKSIQKAVLGSPVRFWPYVVYGQRKY